MVCHRGRGRRLIIPPPLQGSVRSGRRQPFRRRLSTSRLCVLPQHQHEGIFQLGRSGMHLHVLQHRPQCRFINVRPTNEAHLSTAGHGVHRSRRCIQQPRLQHARRHANRRRRHEGKALRPLRQRLRRAVGQYVTGVHHVNVRTAFGLVHVGGTHHHAQLLIPHQLQQDLPQITTRQRIHPHAGLIQQQQFGRSHQGTGQAQFLFHAARKLAGGTRRETRQIRHRHQPGKAFAAHCLGHAMQISVQVQVLLHAQILIQAKALRHVADAVLHGLGVSGHVQSQHMETALVRRQQPRHHPHQRSLARAIRPHQGRELPPGHRQRHPIQRHQRTPIRTGKAPGQALGANHGFIRPHGSGPPCLTPAAPSPAAPAAAHHRGHPPAPAPRTPGWYAAPRSAPTWA